jgi:hypothetical protein
VTTSFRPPERSDVDALIGGVVRLAALARYGDTRDLDQSRYHGPFFPRFIARPLLMRPELRLFQSIDHRGSNVELGRMDTRVSFSNRVMGFENTAEFVSQNRYSTRSQVDKYLEFCGDPDVQHFAPKTNYDALDEWVGETRARMPTLRQLAVLTGFGEVRGQVRALVSA